LSSAPTPHFLSSLGFAAWNGRFRRGDCLNRICDQANGNRSFVEFLSTSLAAEKITVAGAWSPIARSQPG
jgi:hypothetical protein